MPKQLTREQEKAIFARTGKKKVVTKVAKSVSTKNKLIKKVSETNKRSFNILSVIGIDRTLSWIKENKGKSLLLGIGTVVGVPLIFTGGKLGVRTFKVVQKSKGKVAILKMSSKKQWAMANKWKKGDIIFYGAEQSKGIIGLTEDAAKSLSYDFATFLRATIKQTKITKKSKVVKKIATKVGLKLRKIKQNPDFARAQIRNEDLFFKMGVGNDLPHSFFMVGKITESYLKGIKKGLKSTNKASHLKAQYIVDNFLGKNKRNWWNFIGEPLVAEFTKKGRLKIQPFFMDNRLNPNDLIKVVRPKYTKTDKIKLNTFLNTLYKQAETKSKTDFKFDLSYEKFSSIAINEFTDPITKKAILHKINNNGTFVCGGICAKILQDAKIAKFTKNLSLITSNDLLKHPKLAGSILTQ